MGSVVAGLDLQKCLSPDSSGRPLGQLRSFRMFCQNATLSKCPSCPFVGELNTKTGGTILPT